MISIVKQIDLLEILFYDRGKGFPIYSYGVHGRILRYVRNEIDSSIKDHIIKKCEKHISRRYISTSVKSILDELQKLHEYYRILTVLNSQRRDKLEY